MESRMMTDWIDIRNKPSNVTFKVDKNKIMTEWTKQMGHEIPIRVCGPCGRKTIMTDEEVMFIPMTHGLLHCCKANKEDLPPENSVRYKAMHLVNHGEEVFRLTEKGIEDGKVIICTSCQTNLKYGKRVNKPPINTFAHYDLGKIPSYLEKLNFAE